MSGENGTANPEEFEGLDENELVEGPDVVVLPTRTEMRPSLSSSFWSKSKTKNTLR